MAKRKDKEYIGCKVELKFKDFIPIFLFCFIACILIIFLFGNMLFTNIWPMIIIVSFLLALWITSYMRHETKIEALEKKLELVSNGKGINGY